MGASENWSSEYFLYSKSSWSRALRVGYLNRRTFVYSFEVVTKYSQHLHEHLTKMKAFHVKTDIIGDKKESYNI